MAEKLSHFSFLHAKIRIKMVVQGQPFAFGQIVASFHPNVKMQAVVATQSGINATSSLCNTKIVPHVVIDPSKTETYEIDLPICTPNGFFSLKSPNFGSYLVKLTVFNPLGSGTATTPTMGFCMYMSLIDPVFEGITLLSNPFVAEKKTDGTVSGLVKKAAGAVGLLSIPFPQFAPEITLFSSIGGIVGDFLYALGFSKPPIVENQLFPVTRFVDNLSQFDGKSTAIVLAGSQSNSVALSPDYGGGNMDELKFSHLAAIRGLINKVSFPVSAAHGDLLVRFDVDPMYCKNNTTAGYSDITPLAGISAPFTYWTGDLTLRVEIVASVFHRATILIAWDPLKNTVAPTLEGAVQTLQNVTVNISGNTCVDIDIPWKQPNPWALVRHPNEVAGSQYNTNGEVRIFVINPVTSNGSTDPLHMNLYFSSKNYKLALPVNNRINAYKNLDVLLSNEFCPVSAVAFGQRTDLSKSHLRAFGEEYVSIKQLTSKLTPAWHATTAIAVGTTDPNWSLDIPNYPQRNTLLKGDAADTATLTNNFFTWYASAFLGYRGSIRYSFYTYETNPIAGSSVVLPHTSMLNSSNSLTTTNDTLQNTSPNIVEDAYAFTMGNRELGPRLDGVAPMLIPYDYFPMQVTLSAYTNSAKMSQPVTPALTTARTIYIRSLTASGDDGNFIWFLGFPPSDTT
jgi:hypothetical protein